MAAPGHLSKSNSRDSSAGQYFRRRAVKRPPPPLRRHFSMSLCFAPRLLDYIRSARLQGEFRLVAAVVKSYLATNAIAKREAPRYYHDFGASHFWQVPRVV